MALNPFGVWVQTLDSDHSGGLDSYEFCTAINKLVSCSVPICPNLLFISTFQNYHYCEIALHKQ